MSLNPLFKLSIMSMVRKVGRLKKVTRGGSQPLSYLPGERITYLMDWQEGQWMAVSSNRCSRRQGHACSSEETKSWQCTGIGGHVQTASLVTIKEELEGKARPGAAWIDNNSVNGGLDPAIEKARRRIPPDLWRTMAYNSSYPYSRNGEQISIATHNTRDDKSRFKGPID